MGLTNPATTVTSVCVQAADQTVNSTTANVNVTGMKFAVVANGVYIFRMSIEGESPAAADWSFQMNAPAGSAGKWNYIGDGGGDTQAVQIAYGSNKNMNSTGAAEQFFFWGFLRVGGTAGDLQLQFSQWFSDAGDTTIYAGSMGYLIKCN